MPRRVVDSNRFSGCVSLAFLGFLVGSSHAICVEPQGLPLPNRAMVRWINFQAPGLGSTGLRGSIREAHDILAFFDERKFGWKEDALNRYAEFLVSLDLGEEKTFEIRAGRSGKAAFLQTRIADTGVLTREITASDLNRLLKLCGCDLSIALLQPDKGFYGEMINRALAFSPKISANMSALEVDKAVLRKVLDPILHYSRLNPKDTNTSSVLRSLDCLYMKDFVPGWFVIHLSGHGSHSHARMLANKSGKALPATPENCLSLCRARFGDLNKKENARKMCMKVLEGSGLGRMISDTEDIPAYQDNPIPPKNYYEIRPMYELRVGGRLVYEFFVYQIIGGQVWHCLLTVQGETVGWEAHELAQGVGNALYIQ